MGVATSQALTAGFADAIIPDNTFVETLYNMGIFSSLVLLTFILSSLRHFDDKLLPFIFVCFAMTNVIFEMNPVIQIILILMGSRIGKKLEGLTLPTRMASKSTRRSRAGRIHDAQSSGGM